MKCQFFDLTLKNYDATVSQRQFLLTFESSQSSHDKVSENKPGTALILILWQQKKSFTNTRIL